MRCRFEAAVFEVPDDWRDTTTYAFLTADASGSLVVEPARAKGEAESTPNSASLFDETLQDYTAVWSPCIIYVNRLTLRRGDGSGAPAAEGEQLSLDGSSRSRFALVALAARGWTASLVFLLPSSPDFFPLVRRVTMSARFVGETWKPNARPPGTRTVQAGPVEIAIPADWRPPDTMEFLHPSSDAVTITVTVSRPTVPPGSIVWSEVMSEPFRIVVETPQPTRSAAAIDDWETEWLLEMPTQRSRWLVRKSVTRLADGTIVTTLSRGDETHRADLAAAWTLFRGTLQLASGV